VAGVVMGLAGAVPASAQGGPLGNLRGQYPEVRVYEQWGRVWSVSGTPMTAGQTPREAAEAWVGEHGAVFGGPWLELDEFREARLRTAPEGKERRVFLYRQEMDGLPVVGSSFRVMTQGEPESGPARVVYAAGRVAIRPDGGLPEPTVTPAQALEAAKAHHKGREMVRWSEPELVAIYDDAPRGDAVAYPAWRMQGTGETILESYTFYVHALAGEVSRYRSRVAHLSDDITGTVTGWATPGVRPDTWGNLSVPGTQSCPNDPDEFPLHDVLIVAYHSGTQNIFATVTTDAAGNYTIPVPPNTTVTVDLFVHLTGPGSEVFADTSGNCPCDVDPNIWGEPLGPVAERLQVTSPASEDFELNPGKSPAETSRINSHIHLAKLWHHLDLDTDPVPIAPSIAVSFIGTSFIPPDAPGGQPFCWGTPHYCDDAPWPGRLSFSHSPSGAGPYMAYSTVIAHEYGHFILYHLFDNDDYGGFHEGFADTLAHIVYDTRYIGEDAGGCGTFIRDPVDQNRTYPECTAGFGHERGMVLSKVWLNLLGNLRDTYGHSQGYEITRDLHPDWILIAQPPGPEPNSACPTLDQSANPGTLIEVLTVADDNYLEEICQAFEDQAIEYEPLCGESARGSWYVDCDHSGTLDFFDLLCFQNAFIAGEPYADCDQDGRLTFFDYLCFQNEFVSAVR
jgi:hypothetical protein